ncbi:ATP-binding cassette domain-containing protein [Thermanaerothrix sp.]|uniref:ABC transporter ATP-binding protein n=1 Tax=Thermanaerothrix sp. TaxID=2972675 RepID=UPI003C7C6974
MNIESPLNMLAIKTEALTRIYKIRGAKKGELRERVALEEVNLSVPRGELFGLLGPNGAGKTTLIKILTTLLAPTRGQAWVAGYDVVREADKVRPRINMVSGGETSGYGLLTVRENLWMFAQFYGIPSRLAHQRIQMLLEMIGLADRANTKSSDLSTGLRQKMNIVRGFMTDPEVLFLDEPTLGLDVQAAREVRAFIRHWMDENPQRTILLTTHYMQEAEELCDRVAIIHNGRILACDTPEHLKQQVQHEAIFQLVVDPDQALNLPALETLPGVLRLHQQWHNGGLEIEISLAEESVLPQVIGELERQQAHLRSLQKRQPSLEDVFVQLVGLRMEEVERERGNGYHADPQE